MGITYKGLRNILQERYITMKQLREATGLSNDVTRKIEKDEYMTLESLARIARFLNVHIGDLVDIINKK